MNAVEVILRAKLRMARHGIASIRTESKLKVGVVSGFAIGLWFGALILFHEAFLFLNRFGRDTFGSAFSVGDIVMARLLSVMAVSVFFMLIFSNVLVSFATFYRSREVDYLMQSPISARAFFVTRFIECVVFSSWALAYLGSPLIIAYGFAKNASLVFYLSALAFYVPFITVPACLGCLITLLLVRVFPRLNKFSMMALAGCALGLLAWYFAQTFRAARQPDEQLLNTLLEATAGLQSPFLPSAWAVRGVLAAETGTFFDALFQFLLLTSNALFFVWLAAEAARRLHYLGWSHLTGQDRTRLRPWGRGILGRLDEWLRFLRNPERALVVKDIKLFWRDPVQWPQFVIFFGLIAVYIANIRGTSVPYEVDFWRNWIITSNTGACTLVLATLTSRFVFPLVSLEGRRFWILGLAPLAFRTIVWQKFWLSVATTSSFTVGIAVLSCIMLKVDSVSFLLTVYCVLVTNFGLSGLAVGLGTLFPNFQEDNPARIVSGMGGTLNFLLSMGYILLVVAAQAVVIQWKLAGLDRNPHSYGLAVAGALAFMTVLSAGATFIPMRLGLKHLEAREF